MTSTTTQSHSLWPKQRSAMLTQAELAVLLDRPELDSAHPQSRLAEDLGFDSLGLFEALCIIENETGIEVSPGVLESTTTVADLLAWVE